MRRYALVSCLALFAIAAPSGMSAQTLVTSHCTDTYSAAPSSGVLHWLAGRERACEVRSGLLPLNGPLRVKGENGGIEVIGEDRHDIALEARVEAHAHSQADADSLLHQIHVQTNGTITADAISPPNSKPPTAASSSAGWMATSTLRPPTAASRSATSPATSTPPPPTAARPSPSGAAHGAAAACRCSPPTARSRSSCRAATPPTSSRRPPTAASPATSPARPRAATTAPSTPT